MTFAQDAIQKILIYYIVSISVILLGIAFAFLGKKSNKTWPYGFGLLFALILFINGFIPFTKDSMCGNIVVAQGYYENKIGGRKSSSSHIAGIYSVTLETDSGVIQLSTAPGNKEVFILGRHYVTAYYLPESKTLLYIEQHKT